MIIKNYKSKRNKVQLFSDLNGNHFISKIFNNKYSAEFEADLLKSLSDKGLSVPKIIDINNNSIIMEYIPSFTVTEYIETIENLASYDKIDDLAEKIINWFSDFYNCLEKMNKPGYIRGDVNCRNLLWTEQGKIAGVDFEELYLGGRDEDIGKLCAFILTYNPPHADFKKALSDKIIYFACEHLKLNKKDIQTEIIKEFARMKLRR